MPAGEVHEVGLADRLQRGRVVALLGVAHQDRLDLGAEGGEMLDAHLGPDAEGVLAVGRGGGRQDHDARAGTAGGFEQPAVELCHRREELSGANERHRSGHGRSIDQAAEVRSGEAGCRLADPGDGRPDRTPDTLGRRTSGRSVTTSQRWTMLATILGTSMVFLDGTIVNLALPRIGRELPASLVSTLEGQTYVVGGYLAILAALLLLSGALADYYGRRRVFAIGLIGFGITSVLCGLAPTLELLDRRPPAAGRRRRAARAGVARDHHGDLRRRGHPVPCDRHLGGRGRRHRADRADPRRRAGGHRHLAGGVPDQRAARHPRPGRAAPRRGEPGGRRHGTVRLARCGGRDRGRGRPRVRRDPRPGAELAGPGRLGCPRDRRRRAGRVPDPDGPPAASRSCRSACSGGGDSRRSTSRRC